MVPSFLSGKVDLVRFRNFESTLADFIFLKLPGFCDSHPSTFTIYRALQSGHVLRKRILLVHCLQEKLI